MSNRAFCEQNGISEKTYYYWLRKLRENAFQEEAVPQLVKLDTTSVNSVSGTLRLRLKGMELDIPQGADAETLTTVLQAIQDL